MTFILDVCNDLLVELMGWLIDDNVEIRLINPIEGINLNWKNDKNART